MPDKQTWTIDKFDGGINNHADPRDLPVNQFVKLTNVAVHRFGKLETVGGQTVLETLEAKRTAWNLSADFAAGDNDANLTADIGTAGCGLFALSTDIDKNAAENKEDWLLLADPLNKNIDAFPYSNGVWQSGWMTLGTTAGAITRFLYANGAIRAVDANFGAANTPRWKGHVHRDKYGLVVASQWYETDNSLDAPTEVNLISVDVSPVSIPFVADSDIQVIMDYLDDTDAIESEWKKDWEVACSYVYDGNQESLLCKGTTAAVASTFDCSSLTDISRARFRIARTDNVTGTAKNLRVTHIKLYIRAVGTKDWLLQAVYDIDDGGGLPYEEPIISWTWDTDRFWTANREAATSQWMERPLDKYDYEFEAGHSPNEKSIDIGDAGMGWKTAVIANRKTYVGNTRRVTKDGITKIEHDAIYVSLPNQFDKFPASRKLETVGSDGEEIIRLMVYKDKIFEFKDKTLRIINISGEFEFVEHTFYNTGIPRWESAFETPFGIAFGNRLGVWLCDGDKPPINLLKRNVNDKYERTISLVDWNAFYTKSIMVGYNPTQDQLIVLRLSEGSSAKHCYIYTFTSQSWVYSPYALNPDRTAENIYHTNFITDRNNALVWGDQEDTDSPTKITLNYWEDISITCKAVANSIEIENGDINFNLSGIYKYIYEIKLLYRLTTTDTLTNNVTISIDGEDTFKQTAIGNHSENTSLTGSMPASVEWDTAVYTFGTPILAESIAINIDNDVRACKISINEIKIVWRLLPEYRVT